MFVTYCYYHLKTPSFYYLQDIVDTLQSICKEYKYFAIIGYILLLSVKKGSTLLSWVRSSCKKADFEGLYKFT